MTFAWRPAVTLTVIPAHAGIHGPGPRHGDTFARFIHTVCGYRLHNHVDKSVPRLAVNDLRCVGHLLTSAWGREDLP